LAAVEIVWLQIQNELFKLCIHFLCGTYPMPKHDQFESMGIGIKGSIRMCNRVHPAPDAVWLMEMRACLPRYQIRYIRFHLCI